jgi:hypothetical protein
VTELPIVLETSLWPSAIFGIAMLVAAFLMARALRRANTVTVVSGAAGTLLMLLALVGGLALTLQNVSWQLRLDNSGIALRAPFDVLRPGGDIAWPDLTSVEVVSHVYRGISYQLRVRGKGGQEIVVASADRIPKPFFSVLRKVIAERAPQVGHVDDFADAFPSEPGIFDGLFANRYWATDSRGKELTGADK